MPVYINRFERCVYDLKDLKEEIEELLQQFGNLEIRGQWEFETAMIKVFENEDEKIEDIYVELTSEEIEEE